MPDDDPGDALELADPEEGSGIVSLSFAGTGVFVALAIAAAAAPDTFANVLAAVSIALFAVGVVAFGWAYAVAVGRSRTDAIGIGGLYFLAGSAPKVVRIRLMGAFAAEVVAAIASSSVRPFTAVAFGILVPVFGLGLSGLWGARHGAFPPREP